MPSEEVTCVCGATATLSYEGTRVSQTVELNDLTRHCTELAGVNGPSDVPICPRMKEALRKAAGNRGGV